MPARKTLVPPTRAELRIMTALWDLGRATVDQIIHHPSFSPPPNYKTTQTILRIMEEKSLVQHTSRGRVFVFEPRVSRDEVGRLSVRALLEQNFQGSPSKLLVNLLESGPVDAAELEELEALIRKYRQQHGDGHQ
ncbi:MAG TPA: BlaI/MecI/CopY family transcriptional regulator [Candidatus Angelobacter sp.]|nr:BlaI/MecI/CopY family transcriptional regulator [Candidatus Angelobacter sp.]